MEKDADPAAMESVMVEAVAESLRMYLYSNAVFICEALCASFPSESNLLLLATCYMSFNQDYRAYYTLQECTSPNCRYLFATACHKLNKLSEAENALLPRPGDGTQEVPGGAGGCYLLGVIARLTDRREMAIEYHSQALAMNPFLWCAYEELCMLGAEPINMYMERSLEQLVLLQAKGMAGAADTAGGDADDNNDNDGDDDDDGGDFDGDGYGYGDDEALDGTTANTSTAAAHPAGASASPSPLLALAAPHHQLHTGLPSSSSLLDSPVMTGVGPGTSGTAVRMGIALARAGTSASSPFTTPSPGISTQAAAAEPPPHALRGAAAAAVPVMGVLPPSATGGGGGGGTGTRTPSSPAAATPLPGGASPAHRRKVLDEGKLRKVSGRLFGESPMAPATAVRRSARLAAEGAGVATPSSSATAAAAAASSPKRTTATAVAAGGGGGGGRATPLPRIGSAARRSSGSGAPATAATTDNNNNTDAAPPPQSVQAEHHQQQHHTETETGGGGQPSEGAAAGGSDGGDGQEALNVSHQTHHRHQQQQKQQLATGHAGQRRSGAGMPAAASNDAHDDSACRRRRRRRREEGLRQLLDLFQIFGQGYNHLSMYRCKESIDAFETLPPEQYNTGWVLAQVGRAYSELTQYREAEKAFAAARRACSHQLMGLDWFSTVLFHLRRTVDLSYLAQEAVALDRLAPQAWCVMGNACSLIKEHDSALKFFQRALQLDPNFTYAHTLCGHEHVAMDEYDEGMSCYRAAIRCDARHYRAWYGLGTIYLRQEKFEFAEFHFRHALSINSSSSVLYCYHGITLHKLKRETEALVELAKAIGVDAKNPLPKFHRADVLMSLERYQEALAELEELRESAPRESAVWFLMGRIYKRLRQPDQAMLHFSYALDLKPSAADVNLIKSALEKLHVPDEMDESNL